MYCIHCGKEIPDDATFCVHCGKKQIPEETSSQETEANSSTSSGQSYSENSTAPQDEYSTNENDTQNRSATYSELAHQLAHDVKGAFSEILNSKEQTRNDTTCPFCHEGSCQPIQKTSTEVEHKNYKWGSGCCGMFLLGPFGLLCGLCGTGSKTTITSELWWTCMSCGKQHIALADALKKWDAMISALPATALGVGIFFVFLRYLEIGFLTFLVVIGSVAVPILSVWAMSMELAEELGEPLFSYLSPEQKKKCLSMVLGAIAIILVGSWLGFRFLVNL